MVFLVNNFAIDKHPLTLELQSDEKDGQSECDFCKIAKANKNVWFVMLFCVMLC